MQNKRGKVDRGGYGVVILYFYKQGKHSLYENKIKAIPSAKV